MGFKGLLRLFAVLAVAWCAPAHAAEPPALSIYGRLPFIESAELSPDGTMIALALTDGENRTVLIKNLADNALLHRLPLGEVKLRDITWAGNRHLLLTWSRTRRITGLTGPQREWFLSGVYSLEKPKMQLLLNGAADMNVVVRPPAARMIGGKPYAFVTGYSFTNHRGVLTLYKVDLTTNRTTVAQEGDERSREYLVDGDGALVAQVAYAMTSGRWALRLRRNGVWSETGVTRAMIDTPDLVGMGRDGKSVLVALRTEEDRTLVHEVALADGAWSEALFDGGFDKPIFDPRSGALAGYVRNKGDESNYTFLDPSDQKLWTAVKAAFPGELAQLVSWSEDRQRVVVWVDSPTEGPAYALVDRTKRTASWIGGRYNGLTKAHVSPVRPVAYRAKDGLTIHGYLTLPKGRDPKNLPLIVLAHGGPASRDTPGFDWWAQALASRGYAVLQPNFRGSTGYGQAFMEAGFGEWGRKMQTDLSDGVRYLVGEGVADPKRVCIAGASYGGYAALAGATIDQGVYRCAASFGGVSDLSRLIDYSRDASGPQALRYWTRFVGAKGLRDPILEEYSPLDQAARATIPVLLIHGKDDTVVPVAQSEMMARALQKAGAPVELAILPGEDHWLSTGATRLQMLTAMTAFLEKYNPPT